MQSEGGEGGEGMSGLKNLVIKMQQNTKIGTP